MMKRVGVMVAMVLSTVVAGRADAGGRAGDFDYFALVLSWSPTYCAGEGDRNEAQCNGKRPYAFVLHGLWPQYTKGWPDSCRTDKKPWVPQATIDRMLDIMPSPRLVIHEYRKHGTCSGLEPEGYYGLSRRLFSSVKIPPRFVMPNQPRASLRRNSNSTKPRSANTASGVKMRPGHRDSLT